ncbi:MAG: hypothetical protein CMP23_16345 [Rickettsiales bacterium]|nr:hypothetical protein [Rickettsiales bacterium]
MQRNTTTAAPGSPLPTAEPGVQSSRSTQLNIPQPTVPVCIPARWAASRFPGKLLQRLGHGTVLSHTIARASAKAPGPVIVLADDHRIAEEARRTGCSFRLIKGPFRNGSERIAGALEAGLLGELPEYIINVQGDAVGLPEEAAAQCLEALLQDPAASLASCAVSAPHAQHHGRTTVRIKNGRAESFSRQPLNPGPTASSDLLLHIGVYAYRTAALLELARRTPGPLELSESLEQLRWLENQHHIAIRVLDEVPAAALAIDRPHDLRFHQELGGSQTESN